MIPFDVFSPIIQKVLDFIPDPLKKAEAQAAAVKAAQEHEETILKLLQASDAAQAAINQEEAKSDSKFKSYWRPFVGWVCATGFAWAVIVQPVLVFGFAAFHKPFIAPALETSVLMQALFGLLGLGALRTYEKKNGVV